MYSQHTPNSNLRALMDIQDINTITAAANGLLGQLDENGNPLAEETLRARRIQYFYDKLLLDTIKLGSENNVYLKYCKTKEVPEGHAKLLLRRWGGLTEHTVPLTEGIPPKSDMMASESFEGTFNQYGRYMEFSDRVDFNLIDPVIAMYTAEYGDLAIRTAERLAREEMIAMGSPIYAGAKKGIQELTLGDTVGIEDYRLQALKLKRLLVKPINGKYIVICSPEHLYDLVSDPLVKEYMKYTNTAEPYKTGKPMELFNIVFEETMMDDFGYGYDEMGLPGEFETKDEDNKNIYGLRNYTIINGVEYYLNVLETDAPGIRTVADARLRDGSYIPNKVTWDISKALAKLSSETGNVELLGIQKKVDGELVDITVNDLKSSVTIDGVTMTLEEALKDPSRWFQLPVHKSFMFGQEHLIKTGISGRSGAKMYIKPKGSAGVLDPIDQRQSIGFKIDALGFTNVRPEALYVFHFVPRTAHVTQQYTLAHSQKWENKFVQ